MDDQPDQSRQHSVVAIVSVVVVSGKSRVNLVNLLRIVQSLLFTATLCCAPYARYVPVRVAVSCNVLPLLSVNNACTGHCLGSQTQCKH